jgi:hypothetical protein
MKHDGDKVESESLSIVSIVLEFAIYAGLVTGYFYLVLYFLGGALRDLYMTNKLTYAFVALALIVGQGLLLQTITTYLLRLLQHLLHRK